MSNILIIRGFFALTSLVSLTILGSWTGQEIIDVVC